MTKLQQFLRAGGTPEELFEAYGVRMNRGGKYSNLAQFTYVVPGWEEAIPKECRGIILNVDDNFEIVARPFDKFFNYGESFASEIDWNSAVVQEKMDGTLIILYHYGDGWNVATKGSLSAPDFADRVWAILPNFVDLSSLDPDYTYMLEFTAPDNRIVVEYSRPELTLIGIRHTREGFELDLDSPHAEPFYKVVRAFPLQNLAQIQEASRQLDAFKQEGFVVVDKYFNRVKIKSPRYVELHRLKDVGSPRVALDLIRTGEHTEILLYFPELESIFKPLLQKWADLLENVVTDYAKYATIESQKDFALSIQHLRHKSALFQMRRGIPPHEHFRKMSIHSLMELVDAEG